MSREMNRKAFLRRAGVGAIGIEAISRKNPETYEGEIEIDFEDVDNIKKLRITDNGVGMSREEVVQNIGTIAKSGTREFFQSLTGDQAKDARLIGQFRDCGAWPAGTSPLRSPARMRSPSSTAYSDPSRECW